MTTINQFLTDTKSYTTKSAAPSASDVQAGFGAAYKEVEKDPRKLLNPLGLLVTGINAGADNDVKENIAGVITPEYVNTKLNDLLQMEEYAPLASTIARLRKNEDFNNGLLNTIRTGLYDAYVSRDKKGNPIAWRKTDLDALKKAKEDGIPEDKMSLIRNGVADYIFNNLVSEDNTNDSRLLDTFTDIVGAANPADAKAIQNLRKADPHLGNNLIKIIKPQIRDAYQQQGIQAFSGPNKDTLINTLTPRVTGALQDSALLAQDIFPDDEVKPGWSESQHADLNYFGKANDYAEKDTILPYDRSLDPWYDDENDTKSNRVMIGAFNTFANDRQHGIQMLENLRKIPTEDRKNSALYRTFEGLANTARMLGRDDEADKIMARANYMIEQVGEYGKSFLDTESIYDYMVPQLQEAWGNLQENFKYSPVFQRAAERRLGEDWADPETREKRQAAWNALMQKRQERILEDSYYGFFKDPNMQRAARYAAPWLTYGPLLASIGSIFGNNSLWPLVLFGGLGSGLFGYNAPKFLGEDTLGTIDNISSTINQPLGMLGSFLPKGQQTPFNTLLGIKNTKKPATGASTTPATPTTPTPTSLEPDPTSAPTTPPTVLSKPKSNNQPFNTNNQYAGYMKPQFGPVGNMDVPDPYNNSGHITNYYNNPMGIGVQNLS